ncbi:hypothetical protein MI149_29300 (plasmid) [Mycolicibacterium crocinum]|uniref:Uncharacterized protein n=1 Tax=Mycolicibacterium crocinum TaxID=388459 RepID=A0ABY3TZX0_9MYCO|nr:MULTISPECIES: hypothetical protein [Mycolicibacterium]ULN44785.1 hypothetical protein MI149_29300 [Mycolicibacterium crocinum]
MIKTMDEETQIGHLVARLAAQYPGLPSATVSEVVHELYGRFHGARVREFVPLFVERRARTALDELNVSYVPEERHAEPAAV